VVLTTVRTLQNLITNHIILAEFEVLTAEVMDNYFHIILVYLNKYVFIYYIIVRKLFKNIRSTWGNKTSGGSCVSR
jgi:hypothetical protein